MKTISEIAPYILTQAQTNFLTLCDVRFHRMAKVNFPHQSNEMLMQTVELLQASYNWGASKFPFDLQIKYRAENGQVLINTIGADSFPTGLLMQCVGEYQSIIRAQLSQHNIIATLRQHVNLNQSSAQVSSYLVNALARKDAANDVVTLLDDKMAQWLQNLLNIVVRKEEQAYKSPECGSANQLLSVGVDVCVDKKMLEVGWGQYINKDVKFLGSAAVAA